jgi:hypothetical protein
MDPATYRAVQRRAKRDGATVKTIVSAAVREHLARERAR